MCSGIINNQPCNITAILPTRVVVYGVEERGVGDDIVKVKRSTTVAAAARPPPVTTARNWLRTTRTWTPRWGLQCDVWRCDVVTFFLVFLQFARCLLVGESLLSHWDSAMFTQWSERTLSTDQLGDWRETETLCQSQTLSGLIAIIALPAWIWHRTNTIFASYKL